MKDLIKLQQRAYKIVNQMQGSGVFSTEYYNALVRNTYLNLLNNSKVKL